MVRQDQGPTFWGSTPYRYAVCTSVPAGSKHGLRPSVHPSVCLTFNAVGTFKYLTFWNTVVNVCTTFFNVKISFVCLCVSCDCDKKHKHSNLHRLVWHKTPPNYLCVGTPLPSASLPVHHSSVIYHSAVLTRRRDEQIGLCNREAEWCLRVAYKFETLFARISDFSYTAATATSLSLTAPFLPSKCICRPTVATDMSICRPVCRQRFTIDMTAPRSLYRLTDVLLTCQ